MQDFQAVATVQALASLKRWARGASSETPVGSEIAQLLWDSTTSAGKPGQYAAEQAMLKASRWAQLTSVQEKARYISRALGHRKQPRVSATMPKLCPKGGGKIEVLNDVQAVAPRLLTPGGPIRRLILQIPPGAGKTCTYLGVISQFVGNGHTIVIVGDDDVFAVFKEGLRQCPAKVFRRMVGPDGKSMAAQETVYLRDINPHMSAFCTLKCTGQNPALQGDPYTCDANALSWTDTRVYFFNFVMAGNWMQAWSEQRVNKKGEPVASMYHEVSPFNNKLLLVVDEAHKLGVPSMEQTTERWKAAAALLPKYIASLGRDKNSNPYILVGTATVNTTAMPTLSLCLPRVIKGFTDPALFVDDDISKPPRIDLHAYLSPSAGFVRMAEKVKLVAYPPAGQTGEDSIVSVKALKERFVKYRGFATDEAVGKRASGDDEDRSHPCPVSTRALRDAGYFIYEPIDTEENRKRLLDIWAGVVYIVDMSQDFRYYPTVNHPYPLIRSVALPADVPLGTREQYLKLLEKPKGSARWTEVSQFADQQMLIALVQGCLDGNPLEVEQVEAMAPKWKAAADDLIHDARLRGRTMIYPGAFKRKGCDDNYYLLLLAFYLQAKLRPFVKKHCPGAEEHQLVTLESVLRADAEETRTQAPAIYILGDSTQGKYQAGEIEARLRTGAAAVEAGKIPRAEDLVFMLSTRAFRERQYTRYNDEVCPGPAHVPQQAAGNTIIILGEGGHKALDLKCTSNGLILTTMPGGKFQQTQGRVKRSCAFKTLMDATSLWHVNVRTYLLWSPECLDQGPVIDQALHSFYHEQYQIIRYLEMLEAMAGVGCSNWEVYSNWRKTFADFDRLPMGGFRCAHDVDPGALHEANQKLRDFFRCNTEVGEVDEASGAVIERGISGDVSMAMVRRSTHGTCAEASAGDVAKLDSSAALKQVEVTFKKHQLEAAPRKKVHFAAPSFGEPAAHEESGGLGASESESGPSPHSAGDPRRAVGRGSRSAGTRAPSPEGPDGDSGHAPGSRSRSAASRSAGAHASGSRSRSAVSRSASARGSDGSRGRSTASGPTHARTGVAAPTAPAAAAQSAPQRTALAEGPAPGGAGELRPRGAEGDRVVPTPAREPRQAHARANQAVPDDALDAFRKRVAAKVAHAGTAWK
jgi:hypothetical protein